MRRINTTHKAADLFGPGKDGFRNGDMGLGIMPTELNAEWFNTMQEEIAAVIETAGLTLNAANSAQLLEAIKRMIDIQAGNYALDTGTENAYVIALDPAITAYVDGMTVRFRIVNSVTGASTLNAGAGAVPLVNDIGGALVNGDAPTGTIIGATYVSALGKFMINEFVNSQVLSQAVADTLYMLKTNEVTAADDPTYADNSTKVPSTNWVRGAMSAIAIAAGFSFSNSGNGYLKLPSWLGGLIFQWGQTNIGAASGSAIGVTYPIAYPTGAFITVCQFNQAGQTVAGVSALLVTTALNATGFTVQRSNSSNLDAFTGVGYFTVGR